MTKASNLPALGRQKGAALLIILIVMIISGAALFVHSYQPSIYTTKTNNHSLKAIRIAKDALIGWSVSHPNTPGMLPWPDHRIDNNYDGNSDCLTQSPSHSVLSGVIPWLGQTSPCIAPLSGLSINALDGSGQLLWYAVSPNMVYDYNSNQAPVINSGTRNIGTGWLTVRDSLGNVLSNKIAFVIIAPGKVVGAQARTGNTPTSTQYLDSALVNSTTYDNANSDGVFIRADHNSTFNDVLGYITIDELMNRVEKVVEKDKSKCENYYSIADPKCSSL